MMPRCASRLFALSVSLAALSCAGPGYRAVPAWVDKPPEWDGTYMYAVGVCQSALFEKDKEKNALADARQKLAASSRTLIKSRVKIVDQNGRRTGSSGTDAIAEGEVTDTEHLETWRDLDGRKGVPGAVYVLVRMRR